VEAVFDDLRNQRFIEVLLRPGPQDADVWSAAAPEWTIRIPHMTHLLDLRGGFEVVHRERFSRSTRRNIRKAEEAGLTVETGPTGELVDEFYDLYLRWTDQRAQRRHLPRWLARPLARHREPRSKIEGVLRQLGRSCRVWTVRDRGTPVAAAIGLFQGAHFTFWRSASHSPTRESKYANVLVIKVMIDLACASGTKTFDFGESGGVASLMQFKERFGAEPTTYDEYRLERLPITAFERGRAKVMRTAERFLARRRT
jgi:lipid II:glycine glycyltransferase (peptidoglycan interpeptide bridge formation enzyme)